MKIIKNKKDEGCVMYEYEGEVRIRKINIRDEWKKSLECLPAGSSFPQLLANGVPPIEIQEESLDRVVDSSSVSYISPAQVFPKKKQKRGRFSWAELEIPIGEKIYYTDYDGSHDDKFVVVTDQKRAISYNGSNRLDGHKITLSSVAEKIRGEKTTGTSFFSYKGELLSTILHRKRHGED